MRKYLTAALLACVLAVGTFTVGVAARPALECAGAFIPADNCVISGQWTFSHSAPLILTNLSGFIKGNGSSVATAVASTGSGSVVLGTAPAIASPVITGNATSGVMVTKIVPFIENATNTSHVGTVPIPAGATLHSITVTNSVLWTGGTATMKVGDTADDDGYFIGVDLKATDLVLGEVLNTKESSLWGGKEGAYLVAATGRRGPTSSNFGVYYAAGSNILGTITVGTPATTAGRTFMVVTYSVGEVVAAVASGS